MQISFLLPPLRLYGGVRRMLEIANHAVAWEHDVTIYHSAGVEYLGYQQLETAD